jgi:hypothetical protein
MTLSELVIVNDVFKQKFVIQGHGYDKRCESDISFEIGQQLRDLHYRKYS